MAKIIATDWEEAMGISGIATPYGTDQERPLFEAAQTCYLKSDLPAAGSTGATLINIKRHTISSLVLVPQTDTGVTKIMDQTLTFATPAVSDGSTPRSIPGFNHTTTISGAISGTPQSSPYFYNIADSSGKITAQVHEKQLTDQTGAETYIAAQVPNWV